MNKIVPLLFAIVFLFTSCNGTERNIFLTKNNCIKNEIKGDTIKAVKVLSSDTLLLSIDDILLFNNLILVECLEQSTFIFNIFDLCGNKISAFGKIGRAENEFSDGTGLCGQYDFKTIVVNDVNSAAIKFIDIQSSIESNQCIVSNKKPTSQRVLNASVIKDSLMVFEQETLDNYELVIRSIDNRKNDKQIELYKPTNNPFSKYRSFMKANSEKQIIALAMSRMNQVNFLSLESGQRSSCSLYQEPTYPDKNDDKKMVYYCDIAASDNFVYALYMNQTYNESYEVEKPMEIHVFTWDGCFYKKICVNESICRLSVDSNDKIMIARDINDNVYKYYL